MLIKLKCVLKSNLFLSLLIIAVLALCPQDAWSASTVFEKVRQKAASSLKDVKLVVYILGGFGLIGFSFMAIFNKISWKWFANIAISLFLLSVMGLFIDDFTGTSEHSSLLDYGDYLNADEPYPSSGTNNEVPVNNPGEGGEAPLEEETPEGTPKDDCEAPDVSECELSPSKCYASEFCNKYREMMGGASGVNGGNNDNNANNEPVWDPETQSYKLPEVEVVGDKNQANNEPVWDPETQSYRLPEVEVVGDKNQANNEPVWDPETQSYRLPEVEVVGNKV